jgi:hypothetical protein
LGRHDLLPASAELDGLTLTDMAQSTLTAAPKSSAVSPPALTLRVCGTPQDGRLVRLSGVKCSIGSDSQCTLRLRAAGVAPMHCLVIRGPERTIVRRWADETRLNGQPFTTALLGIGDRLAIGSVEFEVVDGISSPPDEQPDDQPDEQPNEKPLAEAAPTTSAAPSSDESPSAQHAAIAGDRRAAAGHGRARARRLLTRLREVRQDNELNAMRLARLEAEHEKLRQQATAVENGKRSIDEKQMLEVEQQRAALEEQRRELDEARARIEEERNELHEERSAFSQAWSDFEQERGALASQRLLLQQELRTFEEHKHALTLERIDWQTDTSRAEADLANRRDELDRRTAALEKQRLELETTRQRLEASQSDLQARQEDLARLEKELAERKRQSEEDRLALESDRSNLERNQIAFEQARDSLTRERQALEESGRAVERGRGELEQQRLEIEQTRQELERNRLAIEQTQGELERNRAELEKTRGELERNRQELEQLGAAAEKARGEVTADRDALAKERAQLEAERKNLLNEQAALADERQRLEARRSEGQSNEDLLTGRLTEQARQLTDATERLNRLTEELKQQQELLEAARLELDDERAQWEAERARLIRDHEEHLAELRSEQARNREVSPDQEPREGAATDGEGDVYARLRSMALWKTGQSAEEAGTTAVEIEADIAGGDNEAESPQSLSIELHQVREDLPAVTPQIASDPVPVAPHASEEEESIDNYMAQLLKRVRGVGAGYQAPSAQPQAPAATAATDTPEPPAPSPSAEQAASVEEVPSKLARRSTAPELSSDLAAMRELANLSARAAIDKHAYRNWGRAAFGKLTIAMLAAATGAATVYFAPAPDSMLMYAGLSSFVITLFWLLQAGILVKNVLQATRRREQLMSAVSGGEAEAESLDAETALDDDEVPPAQLFPVHDAIDAPDDDTGESEYDVATAEAEYDGQPVAEAWAADGGEADHGAYAVEDPESRLASE